MKGATAVRLVTVNTDEGQRACAVGEDGLYIDLNSADSGLPACMRSLLGLGPDGLKKAAAATQKGEKRYDPDYTHRLAPVPDPRKVVCLGLNYRDHAIETGAEIPSEPVIFNKFPSTVIGPEQPIVLPRASQEVDYEAELVVVIGLGGRDIPQVRAMEHVAGYMIGHDVSARDWQLRKPGKQWLAGKTFDTFAPTGPELVTADEVEDPHNLGIRLHLNGKTMQDSSTAQLIFRIDEVIAYLSQ
ncbi:MAG TPA: fumarylacetoacetate hydrolase family protein, partial [Isosphaeraceae bacterium]|nr:fumarylacetoacetate hydrolase family protein [Isosphaeraceae bacterium]